MKVYVVVTDENGNRFEGEAVLSAAQKARRGRARRTASPAPRARRRGGASLQPAGGLDFSLPVRAFANRYLRGLSGPAKFAVLLAKLTGGDLSTTKRALEVTTAWERMTGLIGDYNRAHPTRAKDKGWVDTPKHVQYALTRHWKAALSDSAGSE